MCADRLASLAGRGRIASQIPVEVTGTLRELRSPREPLIPTLSPQERSEGAASRYPATCLMRAISSSTALSTGTFSLTTRFIALAQTFSLLRMVNL